MKKKHAVVLLVFVALSIAVIKKLYKYTSAPVNTPLVSTVVEKVAAIPMSDSWVDKETKAILAHADNLNPEVLKAALTAYVKARKEGVVDRPLITIVDYSKPSNEKRLWVIDIEKEKVLFNTLVAHGKNSGALNATSFSNEPTSLKTSLGVFATADTYEGHNGLSLRMQGLERGFNDKAYDRSIVIHGAAYANADVVKSRGMLGRSWGCPAVDRSIAKPLINTIKNKTIVVAYYPDKNWLKKSTYLNYHTA